jgi:hypothetical protein
MKEHFEFLEEYIEFLEKGVEKLQKEMRPENVESELNKNHKLDIDAENKMLRGQLALQMSLEGASSFSPEYSSAWATAPYNLPQHFPGSTYPTTNQIYLPSRACDSAEVSRHLNPTTAAPRWDHPTDVGQVSSLINPAPPWVDGIFSSTCLKHLETALPMLITQPHNH